MRKKYYYLDLTEEQIETEGKDGREWDTLLADDEYYDVYDMYCENADDITDIERTDGLNFTYTDSEGNRHYVEVRDVTE